MSKGIKRQAVTSVPARKKKRQPVMRQVSEPPPIIKTAEEVQKLREAAAVNVEALLAVKEAIKPGVKTKDLDKIAYDLIISRGAEPTFLHYTPSPRMVPPFPATITVTINEELVHGIPGDRRLEEGDIVSIDCGATYNGYVGDAAYTTGVGKIAPELQRLLDVTRASLYVGIEACVVGHHFGDVSHAIETYVVDHGLKVVHGYGGHGVGAQMHEPPHIPNYGSPGEGFALKPGMTFALEPMVMSGKRATRVLSDKWTVVSADGRPNAHFEHTVAVTENGPEILTKME